MVTKDDLEREINEKLDTDMEWSRMKKDELELLSELIDEGLLLESLAKHVAAQKGSEAVDSYIRDWKPGKLIGGVKW